MLGEKVVQDERGKIVGTRILPSEGRDPRMEVTFQSAGKLLGMNFNNTGTVVSTPKAGGVFTEEGRGIVVTAEGEMASWTYQGIGKPAGPGMTSTHRGSVFFQTGSQKLTRLNSMSVVVSADFDETGNMKAELWEWK